MSGQTLHVRWAQALFLWVLLKRSRAARPLAALAVLLAGATSFTLAATLIGQPDNKAAFPTAIEAERELGGRPWVATAGAAPRLVLPLPPPSAAMRPLDDTAELEAAIAKLKSGSFGVALQPAGPAASYAASVLVDAEQPPLRIDIMGLDAQALGSLRSLVGRAGAL